MDSLGERLLNEIVGENLFDVVLNPCLENKKVADALINIIEERKVNIETFFEKGEFLLKKQHFNHESTDLLYRNLTLWV